MIRKYSRHSPCAGDETDTSVLVHQRRECHAAPAACAACCSRASFRSSLGSEAGPRLARVAAGAMRRLVLVVLRPFAVLALRAFASLVLPPVLDGRVISAPRVKKGYLIGPDHHSGR